MTTPPKFETDAVRETYEYPNNPDALRRALSRIGNDVVRVEYRLNRSNSEWRANPFPPDMTDDATFTAIFRGKFRAVLRTPELPKAEWLSGTQDEIPRDPAEWKPGRYWRAIGPDGRVWCESSNELEVRASMRLGDRLERSYTRSALEWRGVML